MNLINLMYENLKIDRLNLPSNKLFSKEDLVDKSIQFYKNLSSYEEFISIESEIILFYEKYKYKNFPSFKEDFNIYLNCLTPKILSDFKKKSK